jgi:hypothetical protein
VPPAGFVAGEKPFTFTVLSPVDTNIVCYVAREMNLDGDRLVTPAAPTVERLNELNRRIYERLGRPTAPVATPYAHPYFVSRTVLEQPPYSAGSLAPHVDKLGIAADEDLKHGLFVLRTTVMNPHYELARERGKDYLRDFVRHLHRVTRECL